MVSGDPMRICHLCKSRCGIDLVTHEPHLPNDGRHGEDRPYHLHGANIGHELENHLACRSGLLLSLDAPAKLALLVVFQEPFQVQVLARLNYAGIESVLVGRSMPHIVLSRENL